MNNEKNIIIDDSWIGKKVTCEILRDDGNWVLVEDAKIYKTKYNYLILQNVHPGGGDQIEEEYKYSWIYPNHGGTCDTRNLKLVEEIKYPIGFQVDCGGVVTYEVVSITTDLLRLIVNKNLINSSDIPLNISIYHIEEWSKTYPQSDEVLQHNANLNKFNIFNFNDIVKDITNNFYLIASKDCNKYNEYVVYNLKTNQFCNKNVKELQLSNKDELISKLAYKAKVIAADESVKVFGDNYIKRGLIGEEANVYKIQKNFPCTYLNDEKRDTIVLSPSNSHRLLRFMLNEVELIFDIPTILPQTHKLDLTVKTNDNVRLVNNKKLPIERNTICKVTKIVESKNKKYTIKNTKNRPLDIVYLKCPKTNKIHPTYMKNVKKITNE